MTRSGEPNHRFVHWRSMRFIMIIVALVIIVLATGFFMRAADRGDAPSPLDNTGGLLPSSDDSSDQSAYEQQTQTLEEQQRLLEERDALTQQQQARPYEIERQRLEEEQQLLEQQQELEAQRKEHGEQLYQEQAPPPIAPAPLNNKY